MQTEFDLHYPSANMQILGVNEVGFDGNNAGFTSGRSLPWLQDTDSDANGRSDVWHDSWNVTYRDVVILDANNEPASTFNVTNSSLADNTNYSTLRSLFVDAIVPNAQSQWQNPIEPLNIDGDQFISPVDALLVINALSDYPDGNLPASITDQSPFLDPSGDGILSPIDPIIVINQLTAISQSNSGVALTAPLSSEPTAVTAVASVANDEKMAAPDIEHSPSRELAVDAAMARLETSEVHESPLLATATRHVRVELAQQNGVPRDVIDEIEYENLLAQSQLETL